MHTIFVNFKNSKSFDPYRLLFNLTDKINLKRSDTYVALTNLAYIIHGKLLKILIRTIHLKHQLQHEMKNLNCLMDHVLYQIFKIILNI